MDKTIREHDTVVLLKDIPAASLVAGDSGVVVYCYEDAPAYEVEFPNPAGKPRFLVETVNKEDLLKLQPRSRAARTVA
jgi:hypothetical protein